jgi:hypothetical protein
LGWFDLVAYQYQLFGDFTCDLVVGDSRRKTYVLVELEDATGGSLFAPQGKEATPEWSRRSERGVSQLMDWFWKLDDMARTAEFETRFGHRQITVGCLLLIGRGAMLSHPRERKRWEWRRLKVLVNSHKVYHETTDDLCTNLQEWLTVLEAQTPGPGPAVPRS